MPSKHNSHADNRTNICWAVLLRRIPGKDQGLPVSTVCFSYREQDMHPVSGQQPKHSLTALSDQILSTFVIGIEMRAFSKHVQKTMPE